MPQATLDQIYQSTQASPSPVAKPSLDDIYAQSQPSPAKPGMIDMRADTQGINTPEGVKGIMNVISNPVGSISKAITGKSLAENISGPDQDTSKMSLPDMLAYNAKKALGEATEQTGNLALGGGIAKGAGGIEEAIAGAKNGISQAALSDFAQDSADLKYGHDARRVMATMPDVVGADAVSTKAAIENKLQETGKAIGDTIAQNPKANVPVGITEQDITNPIDEQISQLNKADPVGNRRTVRVLEAKKASLLNNFDEKGNPVGPVNFDNMTPQQLFDYKQLKLGNINYSGSAAVDKNVVNSTLKDIRGNLVQKMGTALPELKPLNQDYGDLNSASESIDKVILKQQREGLNGLGVKNLITAGLNNPVNRVKLAQWLYTAPKEAIANLEEEVPTASETIKSWFGATSPEFSLVARVKGSSGIPEEDMNVTKNLQNTDLPAVGKLSAQPIVSTEPAETTAGLGGPELNQEAEGGPAKEYSGPNPQGERTAIQTLREKATPQTQQKEDSLSYPSKIAAGVAVGAGATAMGDKAQAAQISDNDMLKTVLGEQEGGLTGQRAVASALRNRGTLHGAYGFKAIVEKDGNFYRKGANGDRLISKSSILTAKQAVQDSKKFDYSHGSHNWFSDADLKQPAVMRIVKGMKKMGHFGDNNFYRKATT